MLLQMPYNEEGGRERERETGREIKEEEKIISFVR